ncbi:uncharacterized protein SOCE836_034020 [Sorangium cellulosum]|uniref:Nucleoside phosphorylase domain-containing protein n=2 Tax=Polyangiaceae TaxID=49 RepID=A0A4P2QP48_SORCE|nr:uncharacterized protein SOCE836_034020 [Sorangium cellulosum]WCQ90657.1 hypothetical protein NQZ70_03368 [Sorangium sp. Soce836]
MPEATPPVTDIGILTIRNDEFRAVLDAFPQGAGVHRGKRREYTIRRAKTAEGERYTLAILKQIEQGNGEAQEAARDLLDDLEPTMLLVVGIAAGLPSDDITLGDVVIATRVNDYTVEARKARQQTTYNVSGGPIAKELQARVANLVGREKDLGRWTSKLPDRPSVSWSRKGQLYGPQRWQNEVREKLEAHFGRGAKPRPPTFASGPIASSDRLVKDPKVLFPWVETARHLHAIEMEAAGVYRATRDRCLMLAIRGISDIVGLKRSEAWTRYACLSAAAFARAFLRTRPIEPRSLRTPATSGAKMSASVPGPDIRVSARAAIVGSIPSVWVLSIVVENHSSTDFFLQNVGIGTDDGQQVVMARDFVTGEWNGKSRKIEPGNSYSFLVDPNVLVGAASEHRLVCTMAVDKIGRRFCSDSKSFAAVVESILDSYRRPPR